ncbi:hypothetical protein, partial [Aeromonas caviae]|uniref:hypothetical protein n=1 Tax=Aeromonas caviae TaxID=648 RepID=UPI001FC80AF5
MFRLSRNERSHWSGNGVHVESELVFMIGRNMQLPKDANILSTTSPQSHITYVNPDFIKISGFTEEELL